MRIIFDIGMFALLNMALWADEHEVEAQQMFNDSVVEELSGIADYYDELMMERHEKDWRNTPHKDENLYSNDEFWELIKLKKL